MHHQSQRTMSDFLWQAYRSLPSLSSAYRSQRANQRSKKNTKPWQAIDNICHDHIKWNNVQRQELKSSLSSLIELNGISIILTNINSLSIIACPCCSQVSHSLSLVALLLHAVLFFIRCRLYHIIFQAKSLLLVYVWVHILLEYETIATTKTPTAAPTQYSVSTGRYLHTL